MIINISEEYGYRFWEWDYPGTEEELLLDWREGRAPLNFFDPSKANPKKPYKGTMRQVEDFRTESLYTAHVHMPDDTYLRVMGQYHYVEDYQEHLLEMDREGKEILKKNSQR